MSSGFTNVPRTRVELLHLMYQSAQQEPLGSLRFLPFILKEQIGRLLPRLNTGRFRSQWEDFGDFFLVRVQRVRLEPHAEGSTSGDFALFPLSEVVWCFCSIEKSATIGKTVVSAIQQHASRASLIYISTREFRRIFDRLSTDSNRVMVVQHSEYNRQESNVSYLTERKEYKAVFDELAAKDAVARRMAVELYRGRTPDSAFSLNNNGLLSLRYGEVPLFIERLVSEVVGIGNLRDSLFRNRERSNVELHPLEFSFDDGILSDRAANAALIESLASIGKSGIAVFHSNPYIHVLYTDFRDGSSFNIYSSSESALTVVPSTRASVSALMRLYRGISERFADCDVAAVPQSPPTAGEFFGE